MSDKKLDFIVVPNKILHCKKLTQGAKLLMGVIIKLCSSKGYCWASNDYLAEIFDVNRMTISRWVKSLKNNGFIKCKIYENYENYRRNIRISKSLLSNIQKSLSLDIQKCISIVKQQQP